MYEIMEFASHLLIWRSTTESKNIVKLLAISQTIHNVCRTIILHMENSNYLIVCLIHSVYFVFPKSLFSIGDLFTVRHLWVICNEDKCCVVDTARGRHSRRLAYLLCLFTRAYCNSESKQGNSITLIGRAQMIPLSH